MTDCFAVSDRSSLIIGFVINPFAGMGGSVGLKGTDGAAIVEEARRRGARPLANERAISAMAVLAGVTSTIRILTAGGAMGEDVVREAGFDAVVVYRPQDAETSSHDTYWAATEMLARGVKLIMFVGGDGTARDVFRAVGNQVPTLGVPAGVKMHSAVFGSNPKSAGQLAALFLSNDPLVKVREAEVMDLDEEAIRHDRVSAELFGYAQSPYQQRLTQNAKAGSRPGENDTLNATARRVIQQMRPGCLYILGPGTTTRRVADALGLPSTLLGVDAILNGRIVGSDLDERSLLHLMEDRDVYIIVGVLGGQGSLFGRGNQQISADVLRKVGRERIIVISTLDKLIALDPPMLRVDTGDAEVDAMFTCHMKIETGPERSTIMKVGP
ncbi:ATP-NAD kinase family protein [Ochrobactrum sp. SFR4]|uniref:ATP-NAD kinase family protein n=1 Tax=Ochrobactrum sp. SFR4 TaxID=2717368 RepID=UPI001C8C12AF|nr:ATP-NAD kinase family protein [Ochrobactrum sp. SFR4]MBX8827353.1 ATP-NAD kinase family protein [Ochrobactrum sp. SFR4]